MIHHRLVLLGLFLAGSVPLAGCGRAGHTASSGPPPTVVGPRSVLLRTPDTVGYTSFEVSVAFSPDGRTVAAGRMESVPEEGEGTSLGTAVTICDVASGRQVRTIRGPMADSCGVAFSPDGGTLAVGSDRAVKLYEPGTGRQRAELASEYAYGSLCLAFPADGGRLAAATEMGYVVVWDIGSGRTLASLGVFPRRSREKRAGALPPLDGEEMSMGKCDITGGILGLGFNKFAESQGLMPLPAGAGLAFDLNPGFISPKSALLQ